mmetsp:Transcript_25763/g.46566  ORF Transcript_25763/g.46566 Transcript_25763/m.46566 type:complete len:86 (+) Transcript_25763:193-450(+)|eukprot:CAMPEP_0202502638 /NCGR_PEP_ID=MMETSP1361-20130828/39575_1 /ASSEMBLY_ACC=CAM_ASM_000849 /TAXON_ID=210615 /ORGANISM="Staurosira complex sp., Strain CCMP2646" /LENGTH=85 /DNA_ID=CAMNT_0049135693 /DNA_START=136 /DNA_END=393 /DNA_ORIENTATION=+
MSHTPIVLSRKEKNRELAVKGMCLQINGLFFNRPSNDEKQQALRRVDDPGPGRRQQTDRYKPMEVRKTSDKNRKLRKVEESCDIL